MVTDVIHTFLPCRLPGSQKTSTTGVRVITHTHTHTHTHTAGTGKSLTSSEVATQTGLTHLDVGALAKEHELFEGWDEQFQCPILDEDKVVSEWLVLDITHVLW